MPKIVDRPWVKFFSVCKHFQGHCGGEAFGIMKKAEILPNMTTIWLRNQTTEFLLGTDRRKFALSVLVEAEIPRGGRDSENFSQKLKFSGHFLLTSSLIHQ